MSKASKLKAQLGGNMAASIAGASTPPPASPDPGVRFRGRKSDLAAALIRVDQIDPDPDQPRKTFDQGGLEDLAANLKVHGQLQPITVRWNPATSRYTVISGERRWRAAKLGGLVDLRAIVLDESGDMHADTRLELQIIENAFRADIKPIEQAQALQGLMKSKGWSARQLAQRLCVNVSTVTRWLDLTELGPELREAVGRGDVSPGAAIESAKVKDPETRKQVEKTIAETKPNRTQAQAIVAEATGKPPKPVRANSTPRPAPEPTKPAAFGSLSHSTTLDVSARNVSGVQVWSVRVIGGEEPTSEALHRMIEWAKERLKQADGKRRSA